MGVWDIMNKRLNLPRLARPAFFLLFCLLLAGCGTKSVPPDTNELNAALSMAPVTMDPQLAVDAGSVEYLNPMCGRLFRLDPEHGYVPELAESYEFSEDGCTCTFRLREGICYSNGDPIDAQDFVDAFRRIADPLTGSSAIYVLQDLCRVKNVDAVNAGTMEPEELGVHKLDDRTLVIELEQPCPYLPYVLTMEELSPYNRAFAAACGKDYATSPETLLSSGPFIVDRYEPLSIQVHYTKNPRYIDADLVKLDGITLRQVSNAQQAMMSYQAGDADVIAVGGEYTALSQGDPCLIQSPCGIADYIGGNFNSCKAWQNRNIRIALSLALDRKSIARDFLRSGSVPSGRIIPPGFCLDAEGNDFAGDAARYKDVCDFDPGRAKEYWTKGLEELGVKKLDLDFVAMNGNQKTLEVLKDQWERTLPGLTINAHVVSTAQYQDLRNKGEFDLCTLPWAADYPDPNAFLSSYESSSPMNSSHYTNPEFDRLLHEAAYELDPEKRFGLLHQAEDVIMEDLGVIPVYAMGTSFLISDRVKGVHLHFSGTLLQFSFAEKEAEQ